MTSQGVCRTLPPFDDVTGLPLGQPGEWQPHEWVILDVHVFVADGEQPSLSTLEQCRRCGSEIARVAHGSNALHTLTELGVL